MWTYFLSVVQTETFQSKRKNRENPDNSLKYHVIILIIENNGSDNLNSRQ